MSDDSLRKKSEAMMLEYQRTKNRELLNELLDANTFFLKKCVSEFMRRYSMKKDPSTFDELMQLCRIGFVKAIEKYDREEGASLWTYSQPFLKDSMKQYFNQTKLIHLPKSAVLLQKKISQAEKEIEKASHRLATDEEIAESIGCSLKDVQEAKRLQHCFVFNADLEKEEFSSSNTAEEQAWIQIENERIELFLKELDPKTRRIFLARRIEGESLQSLSEKFGLSKGRISQIEKETESRLAEILKTDF